MKIIVMQYLVLFTSVQLSTVIVFCPGIPYKSRNPTITQWTPTRRLTISRHN